MKKKLTIGRVSAALVLSVVLAETVRAGSCPGANPNDNLPDDAALQACLDQGGTVTLDPGSPGYIIATGLTVNVAGTIITSSQAPAKATLIADPGLTHRILYIPSAANVQIQNIAFDGNRSHRDDSVCIGYRDPFASNAEIRGNGFVLNNIESRNTLCGSSLVVVASGYEIANSWFHDNGVKYGPGTGPEPFADGLTLATCSNGYVHDNLLENNTDVHIVDGGGQNCRVINNIIRQTGQFAYAGIGVHDFSSSAADHTGSVYQNNTISAVPNTMGFGISAGGEPWGQGLSMGGSITSNTVSGADINLAVEGYRDGTITGNTLSSPGGGCNMNYTVSDTLNTCLQSDWFAASVGVGGSCSPTGEAIATTCSSPPPPPPPGNNAAQFVSQNVPSAMTAGQTYSVSVTFQNTGTTTWDSTLATHPYHTGSQNPQDNTVWGISRASLPAAVAPGAQVTILFSIKAPATAGIYNFEWRMVQEFVEWFGDFSTNAAVSVSAATVNATPPGAPKGLSCN